MLWQFVVGRWTLECQINKCMRTPRPLLSRDKECEELPHVDWGWLVGKRELGNESVGADMSDDRSQGIHQLVCWRVMGEVNNCTQFCLCEGRWLGDLICGVPGFGPGKAFLLWSLHCADLLSLFLLVL